MKKKVIKWIALWLVFWVVLEPNMVMAQELAGATASAEMVVEEVEPEVNEIVAEDTAVSEATASAEAITGNNAASASANIMDTGDGLALVDSVSEVNVETDNNQPLVVTYVMTPTSGNIDLREAWQNNLNNQNSLNEIVTANNDQEAKQEVISWVNINNWASALTDSGSNEVVADDNNQVTTGEAVAGVNLINLVNMNLLNSPFLLANVTILPGSNGDIILPRQDLVVNEVNNMADMGSVDESNGVVSIENIGTVSADSGNNQVTGKENVVITGEAMSFLNSYSLIGLNLINSGGYVVVINGQTNNEAWGQIDKNSGGNVTGVRINNLVTVAANSGNNTLVGDSNYLQTGNVMGFANITNMVNLGMINSRFFMVRATVFNNWQGRVVVAYPDVSLTINRNQVDIHPGETSEFELSYKNIGLDVANNTTLTLTLPSEIIADSNEWQLGKIQPEEGGKVKVKVKINENVPAGTNLSVAAVIATSDSELVKDNNSVGITFNVYQREPDRRLPSLIISESHNVNGYVYAGDTVSYEIKITNTGEVAATNTKLVKTVYNPNRQIWEEFSFDIGTIEPNEPGNLTFGLKFPWQISAGEYVGVAKAIANSPDGTTVTSNLVETAVIIKLKSGQVRAASDEGLFTASESGVVLGSNAIDCTNCKNALNPLPYLLLIVLAALWFGLQKSRFAKMMDTNSKPSRYYWELTKFLSQNLLVLATTIYALVYLIATYKIPLLGG